MERAEALNIVGINFGINAFKNGYIRVEYQLDRKELDELHNRPDFSPGLLRLAKYHGNAMSQSQREKYGKILEELDESTAQEIKSLHPGIDIVCQYRSARSGGDRTELEICIPYFGESMATKLLRRIGLIKMPTPEQKRESLQREAYEIIYSALRLIAERENGELREKFLAKVQEIEARPIEVEPENPVLRASQAIKADPTTGSFEERTARDPRQILRKDLAEIFGVREDDQKIDLALNKIDIFKGRI